jgi:CRISPR-associated protein Csx3
MNTDQIYIEGNILRVGFGNLAQNDQIVQDAAARLNELIESGQLKGGVLLKVNGPASIPVAFVLAHQREHLLGAIATPYGDGDWGATSVSCCANHWAALPLGSPWVRRSKVWLSSAMGKPGSAPETSIC